jgi:hypothetical protein
MISAAKKLELQIEASALTDDPVWQALLRAPIGAPETEAQKRMSADALRGAFTSSAETSAEIAARCPPGE